MEIERLVGEKKKQKLRKKTDCVWVAANALCAACEEKEEEEKVGVASEIQNKFQMYMLYRNLRVKFDVYSLCKISKSSTLKTDMPQSA